VTNLETRHRSGLICDEEVIVIELFWHTWQGVATLAGASIGDAFPCVHDIAGSIEDRSGHVSPCYWTTWPSLVLPHFRFLLDHVSGPCYFSCQFSISTRVMLRLEQVSLLHWTMCHIFIGPRGRFLFSHVA
jgi:hypothetical protein